MQCIIGIMKCDCVEILVNCFKEEKKKNFGDWHAEVVPRKNYSNNSPNRNAILSKCLTDK